MSTLPKARGEANARLNLRDAQSSTVPITMYPKVKEKVKGRAVDEDSIGPAELGSVAPSQSPLEETSCSGGTMVWLGSRKRCNNGLR